MRIEASSASISTAVLDDPEIRTAALGYIFFRIGQMLDGERPMMLFVDEGWKLLGDDKAGAFINDQLKTIRKKNGIVGDWHAIGS
ncbi:hypothetical protein ACOJBM_06390 [Rhizobium beringeri]